MPGKFLLTENFDSNSAYFWPSGEPFFFLNLQERLCARLYHHWSQLNLLLIILSDDIFLVVCLLVLFLM